MLVMLVGGVVAGGLAVLAAFPATIDPIPSTACIAAAAVVMLLTFVSARRLQPVS